MPPWKSDNKKLVQRIPQGRLQPCHRTPHASLATWPLSTETRRRPFSLAVSPLDRHNCILVPALQLSSWCYTGSLSPCCLAVYSKHPLSVHIFLCGTPSPVGRWSLRNIYTYCLKTHVSTLWCHQTWQAGKSTVNEDFNGNILCFQWWDWKLHFWLPEGTSLLLFVELTLLLLRFPHQQLCPLNPDCWENLKFLVA